MVIDARGDVADAECAEIVNQAPGEAVDIVLHGRVDRQAHFLELPQRLERVEQGVLVGKLRPVQELGGYLDAPLPDAADQPLDLSRRAAFEIFAHSPGGLAGPAETGVVGQIVGLIAKIEGIIDVAEVLSENFGLGPGITDVGMAVLDQKERPWPHRPVHKLLCEGSAVDLHGHRAALLFIDRGIEERKAVAAEAQGEPGGGLPLGPEEGLPLFAEIDNFHRDRLASFPRHHAGRNDKELLPERAGKSHHPAAAAGGGAGDTQVERLSLPQAGGGQIEGHQSKAVLVPVAVDGAEAEDLSSGSPDLPLLLIPRHEFDERAFPEGEGESVLAQVAAQASEPYQAHAAGSGRKGDGFAPPGDGRGAVAGAADQGFTHPGQGRFVAHGRAAHFLAKTADDSGGGGRI